MDALHQKLGRESHRVMISGLFLPESAIDDLKKLQEKAASGAEITFTADIVTALSVSKMVIEHFAAEQQVGAAQQIAYTLVLAENPPLPPPAEVSSFGGLRMTSDRAILVLTQVRWEMCWRPSKSRRVPSWKRLMLRLNLVDQVQALASLGDLLSAGNPISPVVNKVNELKQLGPAIQTLSKLLGGQPS